MEKHPASISMDKISILPQEVLHHILSFLSQKDAVRTCVLSKSWRYLCPIIVFRERKFVGNRETFLSFVDKTLQRYHDQKLSVRELILEMSGSGLHSESTLLLEKWIPTVVMNMGVKTLNLRAGDYGFVIPPVVFQAELLKELYLHRFRLNQICSTDKVLFKNLKTLSLHFVYIEDETLEKIMSSCPLIEYLVLDLCRGLRTIKVNNAHSLKHVQCSCGIDVPSTLETFRVDYNQNWLLYHHNNYFSHLKSLYLYNVNLFTESFNNFSSSNFPSLEEFTLELCYGFKDFQLSNHSIKRLTIDMSNMREPTKAVIDAANILYFKISSFYLPSITFTTNSSEWKSHVVVKDSVVLDVSWLRKLNKLLKRLSQSQISLDFAFKKLKNWTMEDAYGWGGSSKPVAVEHLSIRGLYLSSTRFPAIINCMFRSCRPRYIGMSLYPYPWANQWESKDQQVAEFICKVLLKEGKMMRQCKFWQQDLEELSIQVSDENGEKWHIFQETSFQESVLPNEQNICFRLKWKDI